LWRAFDKAVRRKPLAVAALRQGNQQIPVIARLRATERAQLSDVENLYIYSSQVPQKIPLRSVSSVVTRDDD